MHMHAHVWLILKYLLEGFENFVERFYFIHVLASERRKKILCKLITANLKLFSEINEQNHKILSPKTISWKEKNILNKKK